MDVFDERILSVLKDGKPRLFIQLLGEAGFSHNTLKLHVKKLIAEGVLIRQKIASEGLGRPKFAYAVSPSAKKQVSNAILVQGVRFKLTFKFHACNSCLRRKFGAG